MAQAVPMVLEATEAPLQGTAAAFGDLVRSHQAMVFSIALRTLGDRGLAEDVAQEVFFRLSGRLASIESPEHLVRWLCKVTSRLCIDELRRRPPTAAVCLDDLAGPGADPGDPLASQHLRRLVASLPGSARLAIVLRYQEGLEPAEIARVLSEPVNTIKSRLQRALASLREGFDRLTEGRRP